MKKLITLAFALLLLMLLPALAEDTLVEWIPFDEEGTLFIRYDTYRDYYVLTDKDGQRIEGDSFYAFEDWTYENLLVVAWEGKYGYFDKESGWIIQPQFDFARFFQENGLAAVKQDGLWGFINLAGEVVFQPQFDAYEGDEYLYEDEDYEFYDHIAAVCKDGLWGYIRYDGSFVIEPQFEDVFPFQENGLAIVIKDGLAGFIDLEGKYVFEPQFDVYEPKSYMSRRYRFVDHVAAVSRNRLWGYIRDDGTFLLEPKFAELKEVYDGSDLVPAKKMGLWGYVSLDGEWQIEPIYGDAENFNEFGVARVINDNKIGLISASGEVLFEPQFDNLWFDVNGIARVVKNGKYGFIKADGSIIVEPQQFDYAASFYESAALVKIDGLYGFIDENGDWLVKPKFDYAVSFYEGVAKVKCDSLYGFIDKNGDWLAEPKFVQAMDFSEGLAAVTENGYLWGYINEQGEYVIEPQYYSAYNFDDGVAEVSMGGVGSYGLIDREGNVLLDTKYNWITWYDDGIYAAEKDDVKAYYAYVNGVFQEISVVSNEMYLEDYYPNEGEKVAVLSEKADIAWDESASLPRLDGAKALLPVYAAFAQATYPEDTRLVPYVNDANALVTYTNTVSAYERLMHGEADLILCAGPSKAEVEDARKLGVEFELTCIGYEAFVFIVNAENPLQNITVDEIRGVYSGEVTSWDELGVEGIGDIIAYQRNQNSGSQTTLEKLMGDTPLMEAPSMYVSTGMEDILKTIEYRNYPNAISFTFRFFCKDMIGSGVKMLAIDGVEPTEENIRNGSYPLITPIYAVTRKGETNPNVQIMLNWITDAQGQELVEKSGYVGIN